MLEINKRLKRIHKSLYNLDEDVLLAKPNKTINKDGFFFIDFSQEKNAEDLEIAVYSVIHNIASIKDHLKEYCNKNSKIFKGDNLINSNSDVAIVHDLWNIDKHAKLNQLSRSGKIPKLIKLSQNLKLSTGVGKNSSVEISFDPKTGKQSMKTTGDASATLNIDAEIIDENNNLLGNLSSICNNAISSWENELKNVGVIF